MALAIGQGAACKAHDTSTPVARRGRKARSLPRTTFGEIVRLPNVTAGVSARPDHVSPGATGRGDIGGGQPSAFPGPMSPIAMSRPPLRAPRRLVTETRQQLRDEALRCLEELVREGATSLTIDLSDVTDVDIGGVGILVLLQKRARDRGITTRLAHTPVQVERLLALTQLDYLFEQPE